MSDTTTNTSKGNRPDYSDAEVAVWIKKNDAGTFASISYGPENAKQYAKMNCTIKGLDTPLAAKEVATIFKGGAVQVMMKPKDETKPLYQAFLGRNSDELAVVPWKSDPTKVDHYVNVRQATPSYRQKKDSNGQPMMDEAGQPVMSLKSFRVGKEGVEIPAWQKHGDKWVGIGPVDALYLENNQPRQIQANGTVYNVALLGVVAKLHEASGRTYNNATLSVTIPGEQLDQAQGAAVNYEQTQAVDGEAQEQEAQTGGQVPY